MEFISHFGMFLLQTVTLVVAILILVAGIVTIASKGKEKEKIKIKKLNEKYQDLNDKLNEEILSKKEYKSLMKQHKKEEKAKKAKAKAEGKSSTSTKDKQEPKKRLYVLNFHGDIKASALATFREEVTAILTVATPNDEVLVILESGGGVVHGYGLAASQMERIKQKQIPLTVAVDKVAASGGYLMACVADKIIAAPFAIIGSIGVIAQIPNFHRLLKKKNIEFEQITAGEFKRTLTLFGENTNKARQKMQQDIEEIHHIFKNFVAINRSQVDIEQVATGEHWLATKALELKLVDLLQTSDDYLQQAWQKGDTDLYEIKYQRKKGISKKLAEGVQVLLEKFGINHQSQYDDNLMF